MRHWFLTALILATLGFSSGAAEAARKPVILLLGDSTVADFPPDRQVRGWGQLLAKVLPGCEVKNLAVSGASSKSFLKLPQWTKAQGTEADYWLIQFGHNDQPGKGERSTDPQTDYKENLRTMITMARDALGHPVLVTPPHRRTFLGDGTLKADQLPYVQAMRELAKEEDVPLIDLYEKSGELFLRLGPKESEWITASGERTHFSEKGAEELAALVKASLLEIAPELHEK